MNYNSPCHLAMFLNCKMFVDHFDVTFKIAPISVIPVIIGFAPLNENILRCGWCMSGKETCLINDFFHIKLIDSFFEYQ